ncbi:hypothetical protein CRG98_015963 [Punica granatum]|uniref:Cytochrome P450 89A2-like n=1 Tax=Punica granatum TaxID=22663 RepID=A0A2I0K527_PUNGR|nr:hypothetical protein CRG98_015963 [Punica granatum]
MPEEGKRKLTEAEILGLCLEFFIGAIDTTSSALQWIIANIVKYPAIQEALYCEIRAVVGHEAAAVEEDDLQKLPYPKAVILEGLRRHPPTNFMLPHAVTEDTELGGFLVPKKGTVNFMVTDMGRNPDVWEDPLAFKPERFLCNGDGTYALALLHLEYLMANLVWALEWKAKDGDEVDLSEKQEVTVVMKNPLNAIVIPRAK